MIIVCDSGSTKADWLVARDGKQAAAFETIGLNPFFHDSRTVYRVLSGNPAALRFRHEAGRIFFYGAGCSSPGRNKIIRDGLKRFFTHAQVTVEHDMLGAALAASRNRRGLVCILGTGSNIAYFDGKRLSKTRHGLGYILGDEGSGSYFGRKLVAHFLYGRMPAQLRQSFYRKYRLTREAAIRHVYHLPHANVYLASFAPFLSGHRRHAWIRALVYDGLMDFFESNIASYPGYKRLPVHFIGSIAYHFEDVLSEVGRRCGFTTGRILIRPVDDLLAYYLGSGNRS